MLVFEILNYLKNWLSYSNLKYLICVLKEGRHVEVKGNLVVESKFIDSARKQLAPIQFCLFFCLFLGSDDNSNQSSIADSSPVKQENSCSTSPTPEPTTVPHRENSEAKTDQSPDSKRGERLSIKRRQSDTVAPEISPQTAGRWQWCQNGRSEG